MFLITFSSVRRMSNSRVSSHPLLIYRHCLSLLLNFCAHSAQYHAHHHDPRQHQHAAIGRHHSSITTSRQKPFVYRHQQHSTMPKPSFMQSVLRKPTRSYADPYASSPWADQYEEPTGSIYGRPSHYEPIVDRGAHLGYKERSADRRRDGPNEAGPSRPQARRTVSTVSDNLAPRPSSSMSTRFPRPARKVTSSVELRETVIVQRPYGDQGHEKPVRGDTVRRKKTKPRSVAAADEYSEVSSSRSSPAMPFTSAANLRRMKQSSINDDNSSLASDPSSLPPPLRPRTRVSDSSSARSSPIPPVSPAMPPIDAATIATGPGNASPRKRRPSASVIQPHVVVSHIAPLTPPLSDSSLLTSTSSDRASGRVARTSPLGVEHDSVPPVPRLPSHVVAKPSPTPVPRRAAPRPVSTVTEVSESDADEQAFYTPNGSTESLVQVQVEEPSPTDTAPAVPSAPFLSLQPPTPAAVEDLKASPLQEAESPTGKLSTSPVNLAPEIDSPPLEDDERQSLAPEVGSDSEGGEAVDPRVASLAGRHFRQPSKSQPHSRSTSFSLASRPASRTGSMIILPGQRSSMLDDGRVPHLPVKAKTSASASIDGHLSTRSSKRGSTSFMGDFKVLRRGSAALSERSFGSRSDGTPASGYGKGGWAAAHASSSRSDVPSPVKMLMPSGANDGWADHQVPLRSKFTPLPAASQVATFDNLRLGEELAAAAAAQHEYDYSSASEYSRVSDGEDDGPRPSRSYARQSQSSYSYSRDSDSPAGSRDSPNSYNGRDRRDTIRAPVPQRHQTPPEAPPKQHTSYPPSTFELRYSRSSSSGNASGSRQSDSRQPSFPSRSTSPSPLSQGPSPFPSRPTSPPPQELSRPTSAMSYSTPRGFDAPSFLNPDTLTLLPEMTPEDSTRTYIPDPLGDAQRKAEAIRRTRSSIYSKSVKSARSVKSAGSDDEGQGEDGPPGPRRSKSVMSHRKPDLSRWEGSSAGEGVLMQSDGLDQPHTGGYTTLILPTGAYQPLHPSKSTSSINNRVLGLPHATMAALVLSSSTHRVRSDTPAHLRAQLPPPVDFSSHIKPPTKVSDSQILVQVYAVGIDGFDLAALDVKGRADVGKWVPGRSFVGRCLQVGSYEKELVRGDLVMGLMDVRKVRPPTNKKL